MICDAKDGSQKTKFDKKGRWSQAEYSGKRSEKGVKRALLSKGFAWLSGSSEDNEVLSVGKTSQFFGFVALRHESGRAAKRGNLGRAFYQIATPAQRELMLGAVDSESHTLEEWWQVRSEILSHLEIYLNTGTELDVDHLESLGVRLGWLNAQSGLHEAAAIAELERQLSAEQWETLRAIRKDPDLANQIVLADSDLEALNNLTETALAQYEDVFAKAFSWLTGTFKQRQVIPLGQPAQFFGFVSIRHKSGHGASRGKIAKKFSQVLDKKQRSVIQQTAENLQPWVDKFLSMRTSLLTEMENLRGDENVFDPDRYERIAGELGKLELMCALIEAQAYRKIKVMMTEEQVRAMMEIRSDYMLSDDRSERKGLSQRGEKIMNMCSSCHNSGHINAPNLERIMGQKIASQAYAYSSAMKTYAEKETIWSEKNMNEFLRAPHIEVPGNKMAFKGLENQNDRQAIIRYLQANVDTP